ncbi:hypothetical protein WMY93_027476 [Mugilogobius chulae]|uniref:G-protein coupled receptors family 1 profile domain-containing protein n=1 Tax=Mugilogobius chulae TaxID=88201 RepID=A0AAW0MXL9_9GOBI
MGNGSAEEHLSFEDIDVSADGSSILRILISVIYSVVCAVGLLGNLLVFFLMKLLRADAAFWAVDTALDFSWPFGDAMCKIILSVTVMNMYASVFFLTAMR